MQFLDSIVTGFDITGAQRVKEIEKTTNHDVKAVEYYLKECFEQNSEVQPLKEFLHFACTSEVCLPHCCVTAQHCCVTPQHCWMPPPCERSIVCVMWRV